MDLRHIENLVLERAILHVIDLGGDEPIYANKLLDIGKEEVNSYVVNHILRSLADDKAFLADYIGQTAMIERLDNLLDEDKFIDASKILAERMFNYSKEYKLPSSDLLIASFYSEHIRCFALIKLDFQRTFTHELSFEADNFNVDLVAQDIALPNLKQKLSECVFGVAYNENAKYDLLVIDKSKANDERGNLFLRKFLNAERLLDYKAKTRQVKSEIEKWTQQNLKEDFEIASNLRKSVDNAYRNHGIVSAQKIVEQGLASNADARHLLLNKLEQQGLDTSEEFEIDKRFVDKKMKTKTIRTDSGIVIKGDYELFLDDAFVEITENGDGTVNYLIKNVRHTKEN